MFQLSLAKPDVSKYLPSGGCDSSTWVNTITHMVPTALCGVHTTGKHGDGVIPCLSNGFLLEPLKGRDTVPGEIAFCAIGFYWKPGTKLGIYQQITAFISRLWLLGAGHS